MPARHVVRDGSLTVGVATEREKTASRPWLANGTAEELPGSAHTLMSSRERRVELALVRLGGPGCRNCLVVEIRETRAARPGRVFTMHINAALLDSTIDALESLRRRVIDELGPGSTERSAGTHPGR